MLRKFCLILLFVVPICGQDGVKPPKESASRPEVEKWLTHALNKYASHNTRSTSISVTGVRFNGCVLNFSVVRKANPVHNDTVNAVYKTKGVKNEVTLDLARLAPNVEVTDHVLPEFQTIVVRERYGSETPTDGTGGRAVELVVKYEAAEAIKNAFERMRDACLTGI